MTANLKGKEGSYVRSVHQMPHGHVMAQGLSHRPLDSEAQV
jgi:hypothetical protein